VKEGPSEECVRKLRSCQVIVVDPFQALYSDVATQLSIPSLFVHNFISILVPPENALLPFNRLLTASIGGAGGEGVFNPISFVLHRVLAPFVQSLSLTVAGMRV
jgi:hypothetical protein